MDGYNIEKIPDSFCALVDLKSVGILDALLKQERTKQGDFYKFTACKASIKSALR